MPSSRARAASRTSLSGCDWSRAIASSTTWRTSGAPAAVSSLDGDTLDLDAREPARDGETAAKRGCRKVRRRAGVQGESRHDLACAIERRCHLVTQRGAKRVKSRLHFDDDDRAWEAAEVSSDDERVVQRDDAGHRVGD